MAKHKSHRDSTFDSFLDEEDVRDEVERGALTKHGEILAETPGVDRVMRIFRDAQAGDLVAVQFLIEHNPNLAETPIAALRAGKMKAIEHAARAHLRTDEE